MTDETAIGITRQLVIHHEHLMRGRNKRNEKRKKKIRLMKAGEMVWQAEEEKLAKKSCYHEAVPNIDSEMFSDSDFDLLSDNRATKITKAQPKSSVTTLSIVASEMEIALETEQLENFRRFQYALIKSVLMKKLFGVLSCAWLIIKLVARMSLI